VLAEFCTVTAIAARRASPELTRACEELLNRMLGLGVALWEGAFFTMLGDDDDRRVMNPFRGGDWVLSMLSPPATLFGRCDPGGRSHGRGVGGCLIGSLEVASRSRSTGDWPWSALPWARILCESKSAGRTTEGARV
jgi:hypothetical protein